MDHQIEDHVDVDLTRGERGQTLGLEIANAVGETEGSLHRRVVKLDMTDCKHFRSRIGEPDQLLSLGNRDSNGLLNQNVTARFQQRAGDLSVADGRCCDDHGIGGPCRFDGLECGHPVRGRDLSQTLAVGVVGADATDPIHPRQDTNVVATEVAGSDDCGGEIIVCHQAQDNTDAAGVQFFGSLG
jgi:hypothetical protein